MKSLKKKNIDTMLCMVSLGSLSLVLDLYKHRYIFVYIYTYVFAYINIYAIVYI